MQTKSASVLALAMIAAAGLSGCAQLTELLGGSEGQASIARIVDADWTEEDLMAAGAAGGPLAGAAALFDVRFEYTHDGPDRSASDLEATYQDEAGTERTRPLSDFRSGTLASGDVVSIDGVSLVSPIAVRAGGDVVAQRPGVERDWYRADTEPMPMADEGPGRAKWTLSGEASQSLSLEDFEYAHEEESCGFESGEYRCSSQTTEIRVDDLRTSLSMESSGTMQAFSKGSAGAPELDLSGDVESRFSLDSSGSGSVDGTPFAFGADGSVSVDASGSATLFFDAARDLQTTGTEGRFVLDATGDGFYEVGGHREEFDMDDTGMFPLEDDIRYEERPYTPEPTMDEAEAAFLDRLLGLDLAVGDEFRLRFEYDDPMEGIAVEFDYLVQVTGREDVEGRDALRVAETMSARLESPVTGADLQSGETLYWIDADTYVPVLVQSSHTRQMDADDLEELAAPTLEALPYDIGLPEDIQVSFTVDSTLRLVENTNGFAVPAVSSLMWGQGFGLVPAAAVFTLVSDLGEDEYQEF